MQNRINNKQQTKPIQTHDKQTTENQVERENLDGNQRKIDSLHREEQIQNTELQQNSFQKLSKPEYNGVRSLKC